jgi:hypothetical protein
MNLRDKILNAKDIKEEIIKVEEWDCDILIKAMTGKERAEFLKQSIDKQGNMDFEKSTAQVLVACCFDPDTKEKIFTPLDVNEINKKSSAALDKISKKALELSGLGKEGSEEAKNS